MSDIQEVLDVWVPYLEGVDDWRDLVGDVEPKPTGCGPVYELTNPIERPNESFAVADMRDVKLAEPHYHPNVETEIYIVLQGVGLIVVGREERLIEKGSVIVTPPDTTHYTIPTKDLVLAVINTPPFQPQNYVPISETDLELGFDKAQLDKLTSLDAH